ncbi:TrbC/VirB2 family protein [Candidatus Gracilibacteria bacterium]|nr:TrbC/VirB2 family protein [Candidatus Gracilibacteria bacterium]
MKNTTPLTLYPSKTKMLVLLLMSIVFAAAGIGMIYSGDHKGWFVFIFFGLGIVVFTINLFSNSSYLRITNQGLEIRSLYKSSFIKWDEVEQFGTGRIGLRKIVTLHLNPNHTKFKTGALPDTYGKSAEELAELLNGRKEKYDKHT